MNGIIKSDDQSLAALLDHATAEINAANGSKPPKIVREVPPFVSLSEQLAASILESAKQALTEAENNMRNAEAYAEKLRGEIKSRAEEHADLTKRIQEFGHRVLTAHEQFHGMPSSDND